MADSNYVRGEMDIAGQKSTWDGFMKASIWGGFVTILIVAYLTFTLAIGMNWMVSLVLVAGAGLVGGLAMGMGGAWVAVIIGLTALAVFVQIIITLFGLIV